jgi:O-6-methylguanine DNA methyltransferase
MNKEIKMRQTFSFNRLRLGDLERIIQSELSMPYETKEKMRYYLSDLQQACERKVWLITESLTLQPVAVLGLQAMDKDSQRYRMHLFCQPEGPSALLIEQITDFCMTDQEVYRIETDIHRDQHDWIPAFLANEWKEEGMLVSAFYQETTSLHEDVLLYSCLRPRQKSIGVGLVLFKLGVFVIIGDESGVREAHFARYGERSLVRRVQEAFEWHRLTDQEGCLTDRESLLSRTGNRGYLYNESSPLTVKKAVRAVDAYFNKKGTAFDCPLHLEVGSDFQKRVWSVLQTIPFGVTWTYEEVAEKISDDPPEEARKMARAVGTACRTNPFPLFVPCHRVIGKDGRLVGFGGGLDIKEYLLAHEIMGLV